MVLCRKSRRIATARWWHSPGRATAFFRFFEPRHLRETDCSSEAELALVYTARQPRRSHCRKFLS